jgi:hypothetical protein
MKIIRKIEFQMTDSGEEELFRDDFWHEGGIEHLGGGPSAAQNRAADSQTAINAQLAKTAQQNEDYTEAQRNKTTPFYGDLMKNGPEYTNAALDYAGGTNARAYAPARAALIQRIGQSNGLPSGYRDQALTDFDEQRAQGYDNALTSVYADRQAARERGAAGLMGEAQQANPLGYYGAATQGNTSILNANLRKPGIGGIIGGIAGGAASAIPV